MLNLCELKLCPCPHTAHTLTHHQQTSGANLMRDCVQPASDNSNMKESKNLK